MNNSSVRSLEQKLNTWVQIIAIVIATIWGIYTFIYKEITMPQSVPVNVSLNLELRKVVSVNELSPQDRSLVPIQVYVSATNPSSRAVDLLPSAWMALAYKIGDPRDAELTPQQMSDAVQSGQIVSLDYGVKEVIVVAGGNLITDIGLKPNETVRRSFLIYVPVEKYDQIEVIAVMPTAKRGSGLTAEWNFDNNNQTMSPTLYRVASNGEQIPLPRDASGNYVDEELELQQMRSSSTLSLW